MGPQLGHRLEEDGRPFFYNPDTREGPFDARPAAPGPGGPAGGPRAAAAAAAKDFDHAGVPLLAALDDRLVPKLESGAIKLLRADALRCEALMPKKILRRQALEDLERRHSIRLFLLPAEAVAAVRAKDRRAGGLTYGWQTVDHPDVTGVVLTNVRRFLCIDLGQHVVALFWDFASLPQKPRSATEEPQFKEALPVMGDMYASPLGTMVLRHTEVPPCPAELAGELVVLGAPAADGELLEALGRFGKVLGEVRREEGRVRVRLESQEAAEAAAKEGVACAVAVFTYYNPRPYFHRGWCNLESGVATEPLARARFFPAMQAVLARLPPKLVEIDGAAPREAAAADAAGAGDEGAGPRIARVRAAIENATFTGKGDKATVQGLYNDYITNVGAAFANSGRVLVGEIGRGTYVSVEPATSPSSCGGSTSDVARPASSVLRVDVAARVCAARVWNPGKRELTALSQRVW